MANGNDTINRSGEEQVLFANRLQAYYENILRRCKRMQDNLNEARPGMRSDNAVKALNSLEEALNEIIAMLPGIAEFSEGQKVKGRYVINAKKMDLTGKRR